MFQKEFLLNVQNAYATIMLAYLMKQLCHCLMHDQCAGLMLFYTKFNYYFVGDMLICDPSLYLHHVLSFVTLYIYTVNFQLTRLSYSTGIAFGMIEISTVFLTIRAILKNYKRTHPYIAVIYNINNQIFVITFFYTRVYLYYKQVLRNQDMYDVMAQTSAVEYHVFNTSLHLIYFLNLYWAYQIIQSFVKPLFARIAA
jgi:hypothetical protein